MEKDILEILEKDSRITAEDIAVMLGKPVEEVNACIKKMEDERLICGYTILADWDKVEKEYVIAMIEVKVTPQRDAGYEAIAKRIYKFDEVKSVYLMSGAYDFMVLMEGKNIKEISHFISSKLSTLDSVTSTATHFVLKKYKDYGIVMDDDKLADERMIVSP
ncbi:MAG: Lrp/AsnC family transcriptional regulator [Clostridiales bacterium]|nr:Lrp/AsnC family transcriptional regulator [Clostridiales bacterium]